MKKYYTQHEISLFVIHIFFPPDHLSLSHIWEKKRKLHFVELHFPMVSILLMQLYWTAKSWLEMKKVWWVWFEDTWGENIGSAWKYKTKPLTGHSHNNLWQDVYIFVETLTHEVAYSEELERRLGLKQGGWGAWWGCGQWRTAVLRLFLDIAPDHSSWQCSTQGHSWRPLLGSEV